MQAWAATAVVNAQVEPMSQGIVDYLIGQGILGVIVVVLGLVIIHLRKENREQREANKVEVASLQERVYQLQESRIKEANIGYDVARSTEKTLDAVMTALRHKGAR